MAESHDIEYRRMVSNIARELNAADVEQIAYVRLTGREDTTKYSAANPSASALDLLKSLERWGSFSVNNINGLKDVVKDARRNDLVEKINHFMIEEGTKSKYLEELNFTKNRPRNKGRQNDDTSLAEELAGKFQDPGHRVFIADRRKAPQILQRSDIVQELKTRTREISQHNGGLTSASTAATEGGENYYVRISNYCYMHYNQHIINLGMKRFTILYYIEFSPCMHSYFMSSYVL